jgi:hypothetical protein
VNNIKEHSGGSMRVSSIVSHLVHDFRVWRQRAIAVAIMIGLALGCSISFAQSGAGSIQGTVTDSTGAVMPGASIHVINQATGSTADTKANGVGFYQVPGLFTGVYDVTITATGMKTYKTRIELLVDQNAVINATMTAGEVTQEVEVKASFVQLTTTDNGVIASTLENERINQIPMNGRNVMNLIGESTPGLENCIQGAVGTCANGLMGQAMEYVADGVTLTNREFGGEHMGLNQMPDPDSIQEVRVETSGVGAQFATPAAMARSLKLPAITASALPKPGRILPTTLRPTLCATNSAHPPVAPLFCRTSTTERTSRSGSLAMSVIPCPAPATRT